MPYILSSINRDLWRGLLYRKQLDFGSVLGADKGIILPDSLLLKVLHAHTRAEVITDFCVSRKFDSFAELEWYLEKYWHLMDTGDFNMVGHESGKVLKIACPSATSASHYGAATRKQGCKLQSLWEHYGDDYGVFGFEYDDTDPTCMFIPSFDPTPEKCSIKLEYCWFRSTIL